MKIEPSASQLSPGSNITVTFSESMDPESLDAVTVRLFKKGSKQPVAATLHYPSSDTVVLDPKNKLATGEEYFLRVATGAADLAGNTLAERIVRDFKVKRR